VRYPALVKFASVTRVLFVIPLFASGVARGQTAPIDERGAEPPSAADFGKGAEEVAARLRELTRSLSDAAAMAGLDAEVTAGAHRAAQCWDDTGRLLARNLRTMALDSLTTSWQALRSDLEDLKGRIELRARRREADLATLTALHDSWTRALDLARKADAPPTVLERVQSTVATIDQTRSPIEQRHARVLVLQDSVIRALQTCDDALARIADARREAIVRAFTPQEPPFWRRGSGTQIALSGSRAFAADFATNASSIRTYVTAYRGRFVAWGLITLVLMILLHRARSQLKDRVEIENEAVPTMSIVRTPYAAAILIGVLITVPLRPIPPYAFQQGMTVLVMTASVLVFRPILEARLAAVVYGCCALLVVHLTSQLLEPNAVLEQLLLMIEMGGTAGLLLWAAGQFTETKMRGSAALPLRRVARILARILAFGCGVSAVAAALGYLDLADFVGMGLFYALLLTFGLLAVRIALSDLVTVGLTRGPLARLHTIIRHRALIDRRTRSALDASIMVIWIWFVLRRFQLLEPARDLVHGILDTRLRVGELDLPVAHVLAFIAVVIGVFVTTRFVGTLLEEDVYSRMTLPRGVPYALSTLTRYTFLLVGFLFALATLGLDLTRITVLVSALGLGLGFGLQQIMNNFVSGLILLFERPVQVGDSIQMGDLSGDVLRIGIRSSTVRTSQGAEVIVPNSKMLEEKVTNWTLSDRRRRIELDIGVKDDVDAERIITILTDVARRDSRVSQTPPPEVLLVRFGNDGADFQLRFWTDDPHWTRLRSDLSVTLQRMLRALRSDDAGGSKADSQTS
jgi:potassium-dependent mechanosensitive channel